MVEHNIKKRERETWRYKFNLMRNIIINNQEISETEFKLIIDEDFEIGHATYDKIKKDFRINSEKVGIHYDNKEKSYRVGAKSLSLSSLTLQEKEIDK